ncbi:hypothetical protein [Streptomyces catenulae]|uniref:Lipoprotein n=1 Tax=Streptomyces catenulae TaxID=66875 RepID=A0ABV2YTY4_9ACTN|nr:hypothetical protein [Streptomyces catenulae]
MITATAHRFRGRAGRRIALAVAAAAALGMGVTACGQSDTGAGKVNASTATQGEGQGQSAGQGTPKSAGAGEHHTPEGAEGGATGGDNGGGSTGGGNGGSTDNGNSAPDQQPDTGEKTLVGKLSYLAPGKLIVKPESGGMDQAFLVANATKILGAAAICGDSEGNVAIDNEGFGTRRCTVDQLETAAKTDSVTVRVTMDTGSGGAEVVAEKYHP